MTLSLFLMHKELCVGFVVIIPALQGIVILLEERLTLNRFHMSIRKRNVVAIPMSQVGCVLDTFTSGP